MAAEMSGDGPNSRDRLRALTGLRGVAALWVAVYHLSMLGHGFLDSEGVGLHAMVQHGYLAVDVFFVLSGFIMAVSYRPFFAGRWSATVFLRYMVRRLGRVYPLYLAVLLLSLVLSCVDPSRHWDLRRVLFNLAMVQAWGFDRSIVLQSWSVSSELAAYLLMPLLLVVACHASASVRRVLPLLGILGFVIVAQAPIPPGVRNAGLLDVFFDFTPYPLIRCLSGFCLGLATYAGWANATVERVAMLNRIAVLVATLFLATLAIPGFDLASLVFVPVLILVACGTNAVGAVLSLPAVVYVGEISYAIYLIHIEIAKTAWTLVAEMFVDTTSVIAMAATLVLFAVLLAPASFALYAVIECPGRTFGRRLERWISDRAAARAARLVESRVRRSGTRELTGTPVEADGAPMASSIPVSVA